MRLVFVFTIPPPPPPQLPVYQERVSLGNVQLRNSSLEVGFDPVGQILQANIDLVVSLAVAGALLQVRLDPPDLISLTYRDITRIRIHSFSQADNRLSELANPSETLHFIALMWLNIILYCLDLYRMVFTISNKFIIPFTRTTRTPSTTSCKLLLLPNSMSRMFTMQRPQLN